MFKSKLKIILFTGGIILLGLVGVLIWKNFQEPTNESAQNPTSFEIELDQSRCLSNSKYCFSYPSTWSAVESKQIKESDPSQQFEKIELRNSSGQTILTFFDGIDPENCSGQDQSTVQTLESKPYAQVHRAIRAKINNKAFVGLTKSNSIAKLGSHEANICGHQDIPCGYQSNCRFKNTGSSAAENLDPESEDAKIAFQIAKSVRLTLIQVNDGSQKPPF